jgi:hypothetical protein
VEVDRIEMFVYDAFAYLRNGLQETDPAVVATSFWDEHYHYPAELRRDFTVLPNRLLNSRQLSPFPFVTFASPSFGSSSN